MVASSTTYPTSNDTIARSVLSSEVISGCEVTIDGSTFSVGSGVLRFAKVTPQGTVTLKTLNFPGESGITPLYPDSNNWLVIDEFLTLSQNEFQQEHTTLNELVTIGQVIATPGLTPAVANNETNVNTENLPAVWFTFKETAKPLKHSGMILTSSGNNDLEVKSSGGEMFLPMIGALISPDDPNILSFEEQTYSSYIYVNRNGAGGWTVSTATEVQTDKFDANNETLDTLEDGYWSIQRFFFFNETTVAVEYGQHQYCTPEQAIAGYVTDAHYKFPPLDGATFYGYLLMQKGATNLDDPSVALFINPPQVNGENGVILEGTMPNGTFETSGTLNQGDVSKLLFCPEYQYFSREDEQLTDSDDWVTYLTNEVTVEGGTYLIHYCSEVYQTKAGEHAGFRFQIEGTSYGEVGDGVSPKESWEMRAGFVEVTLAKGTYTMNIDYGVTVGTGVGGIRRGRYYLEKKRK